MVWNAELSLRYLPRTSMPVDRDFFHVALVHVRHELREIDFLVFLARRCPAFTTCHSRKAESTITSQKTTVLTVEFT